MARKRRLLSMSWLKSWPVLGVMLLGAIAGVALFAGGVTLMHKTSDSEFCVSCHSMQRPLAEYQGSIHFQNSKGIRAECADCHVPPQPVDYLLTKAGALKDVVGEISGKINSEEKYNAHKLEMAESVWKTMKANDSATCRSCHSFEAMDTLAQRPEARKAHPTAMREGQTCIDCHRGVAHILPDMSDSNASGAAQLLAAAAHASDKASTLYAVATQPFRLAQNGTESDGTLFPSTKVTILQRDGDQLQARLDGWRQQDVPGAIYAAPGKRIMSAVLDDAAAKQVEVNGGKTDGETGQRWDRVSLTLWLPTKILIDDQQKIWQYAAGLMSANCTGCHGLTALDHFTANQWIGVMKGMAPRTSLNEEQLRLLTQYAQKHASDSINPQGSEQ